MSKHKKKSLRLPNKYGGVVFLGERRRRPYAARITTGWTDEKRQKYKYLGYFERREDALACLADFYRSPYDADARKTTFAQVFEAWADKHADQVSKASMTAYKSAYKKIEMHHNTPLTALRASHIQSVINACPYSTAKMVKLITGVVFREAMAQEIVKTDISALLTLPKKGEKKEKRPFDAEEIALLWSREGEKYADILLILLYTGMRISELLEMETEKIDLAGRLMVGGKKTTAGLNRTIPIHKKIAPIIERVCGDQYLFQSPRGKHFLYSNEGHRINKYMRDLGFDHTIHETRHTFISQCDRLGLNSITVKRIVGHSTGEKDLTKDVYTHKNAADLLAAIDAFSY